jgi:hypothetical protein
MQVFLHQAHYDNTSLTSPIDLTPLAGWFNADHSIDNVSYFLGFTHYNNTSLDLTGQKIFPDWIQTLTEGVTEIEDVSYAFYQMFYCGSAKGGDSGEPTFEDGNVLSSLGTPSTNKGTYTGRTDINTSPNTNWK